MKLFVAVIIAYALLAWCIPVCFAIPDSANDEFLEDYDIEHVSLEPSFAVNEDTLMIDTAVDFVFLDENYNEVIRIAANGDFYYRGRLVVNDYEVYEKFKAFLQRMGL